jgi:Protein of unknown function (DUF2959)
VFTGRWLSWSIQLQVDEGSKDSSGYLKRNLNAQAIASLKGEATSIQTDTDCRRH